MSRMTSQLDDRNRGQKEVLQFLCRRTRVLPFCDSCSLFTIFHGGPHNIIGLLLLIAEQNLTETASGKTGRRNNWFIYISPILSSTPPVPGRRAFGTRLCGCFGAGGGFTNRYVEIARDVVSVELETGSVDRGSSRRGVQSGAPETRSGDG